MSKEKIYRPRPISGFPEWLPEQRMLELNWLDKIRHTFESFGFCSIETPSVEELDVLLAKGETDNEIYTLTRLQADADDTSDARLALHYDLTVPFARYVAQHFSELVFPFKRYQIQRSWRGERPQDGRYREFYQCDIDVINVDSLPLHFDAEIPAIIYDTLCGLEIGGLHIHINNRKILEGYFKGLGIEDAVSAIRIVDKLGKIGEAEVIAALQSELKLSKKLATQCLEIAAIRTTDASFVEEVKALEVQSDLLDEGLGELVFVMDELRSIPNGAILADLSVARGFDYYTGTVYETTLLDFPNLGSICSGGRYDDLAGSFINRRLPGVGISIGLSRLFGKLITENRLETGAKCPTDLLMVFPNAERREDAVRTANLLRQRGFKVEMYHTPGKISRQLRYVSRKGIPYAWFPPFEEGGVHEVKDMKNGEQTVVDPEAWNRGE